MMYHTQSDGTVPNTRQVKKAIEEDVWGEVLLPYYIGQGNHPLIENSPQSPYTKTVVGGIRRATQVQVERQIAMLKRTLDDPEIVNWLTSPRPAALMFPDTAEPEERARFDRFQGLRGPDGRVDFARARADLVRPRSEYDALHRWVDPNGHTLSDRVWNTAENVRERIDRLMDYHIGRGTAAVDIAKELERFLTPGAAGMLTTTPYGTEGSYAARRLARTEITVGAHRATVLAAQTNPMAGGVQWKLSPQHPEYDICDELARGGPNRDGIYPIDQVPAVPHPHCVTPGQMVTARRGNVPIEQIVRGDEVLTHTGHYRPVQAAWHTPYDGIVYRVNTRNGAFEVTGNHPVLTRRGWINAECLQAGDEVLYAGIHIGQDGLSRVAENSPAVCLQPGIPALVESWLSAMPVTVALDSDLDARDSEVQKESTHLEFTLVSDSRAIQGFHHHLFQRARVIQALPAASNKHGHETGIVLLFCARDFTGNYRVPGRIVVTGQVSPDVEVPKILAGGFAALAVILFPACDNSLTPAAHRNAVESQETAQHPVVKAVQLCDLRAGQSLHHVHIVEEFGYWASVLFLQPQTMELLYRDIVDGQVGSDSLQARAAYGANQHDSLLSLSPDYRGGHGSGNPFVSEVASPTQAQGNYTPILAITQRRYQGPVYNMEVQDDHSYTVNGMVVHNCLCNQVPVPIEDREAVVARLHNEIRQAKGELTAAVGPQGEIDLKGILNPEYLTESIMNGTLEKSVEQAVVRVRS
jgi:hypothetical protein